VCCDGWRVFHRQVAVVCPEVTPILWLERGDQLLAGFYLDRFAAIDLADALKILF